MHCGLCILNESDLSVLAIAIHGAMQVYRPTVDTHDPHYGLNPYRHYINTILLVVPLALASLAFINSDEGYTSGGAVCWLPVRPIWYRLGLSWIPRYIIFVVIVVVETAVYMHVRHQMAGFDQAWKNTSKRSLGRMPPTQGRSPPPVVWGDPFSFPKPVEDIVRLPSHDTINKATSQLGQLETEVDRAHSTGMMFGVMDARRETMLKQMRLTFVYPVIYIALWVIPCVLHSMLFSDRFATDPPMVLGSLSILSIASMGFANAICFLIRERPWEEVGLWPRWARRMLAKDMDETNESAPEGFEPAEQDPELLNLQPSFQRRPATLIESIRNSHENSKISEHGVKPFSAKARAKARLALERLDRRRSSRLEQLGGEAVSPSVPQRKPSIAVGERHWWDNYDVSLDEGEESISIQMENTDDMAVERRD